jgi:hypothetical protein
MSGFIGLRVFSRKSTHYVGNQGELQKITFNILTSKQNKIRT